MRADTDGARLTSVAGGRGEPATARNREDRRTGLQRLSRSKGGRIPGARHRQSLQRPVSGAELCRQCLAEMNRLQDQAKAQHFIDPCRHQRALPVPPAIRGTGLSLSLGSRLSFEAVRAPLLRASCTNPACRIDRTAGADADEQIARRIQRPIVRPTS